MEARAAAYKINNFGIITHVKGLHWDMILRSEPFANSELKYDIRIEKKILKSYIVISTDGRNPFSYYSTKSFSLSQGLKEISRLIQKDFNLYDKNLEKKFKWTFL